MFDISAPIESHHHKIQTQILIVLEGKLEALLGSQPSIQLEAMQTITILPGTVHALKPITPSVRFLAIDSPPFEFPNDVYYEK